MYQFWRATFAYAFPSSAIISERSSPSMVRFAAPNNGAPLTGPGRSNKTFLSRAKSSVWNWHRWRRHFGTLFRRYRHLNCRSNFQTEHKHTLGLPFPSVRAGRAEKNNP